MKFTEENTYLKKVAIYDKDYQEIFYAYDWYIGKLVKRIGEEEGEYLKRYFGVKEKN